MITPAPTYSAPDFNVRDEKQKQPPIRLEQIAEVRIADVVVPERFASHFKQQISEKNLLVQRGIDRVGIDE